MRTPRALALLFFVVAAVSRLPLAAQHEQPASAPSAPAYEEKWISNIKQVTFEGQRAGEGYFSADGKEIIYQAVMPGCPHYQIYTRSLAGGPQKMLSVGKGMTTCAFFHPTDDLVLFASTHSDEATYGPPPENAGRYAWNRHGSFEIYTARRDGSGLTRLTDAQGYDAEAAFSRDGGRIVFTSERDGDPEIYTMKSDGTDVRRVTRSKGYDGGPFFSPDGNWICYRGFRDPRPGFERYAQIYVIDVNGRNERQMTFNTAVNWAPYFHPDGKHLAYCTNIDGPSNFELVLMRIADQKIVRMTFHGMVDIMPVFSPDGKKIMWTTSRFGNGNHLAIADFTMPPAEAFGDPLRDAPASAQGGDAASGRPAATARPTDAGHGQKPAVEVKKPVDEKPTKVEAKSEATVVVAAPRVPEKRLVPRVEVVTPIDPNGAETAVDITASGCLSHVRVLSSDALEGRRSGTRGADMALAYIEADMKKIGLLPAGTDGFRHDFEISSGAEAPAATNSVALKCGDKTSTFEVGKTFTPLVYSANTEIESSIAFVGYGVTTADGAWDDYKGLDVKGKIVLAFLRGTPDGAASDKNNPHGGLALFQGSRYKAFNAKNHGAAGIIFVADARQRDNEALEDISGETDGSRSDIPAVQIKRSALIESLKGCNVDFVTLEAKMLSAKEPMSVAWPEIKASMKTGVTTLVAKTSNVVGMLKGTDQNLANEAIIIGAHYDHLGFGGHGSLEERAGVGQIHNGADDNASGVGGLLELAEYFAAHPTKRPIIFMAYSGEEEGLLGSAAWVGLTKDLPAKVAAMINMDMIGRLGDEGLAVDGVETAKEWRPILTAANTGGIKLSMTAGAMSGRSDHASFIFAKVPAIHFFTGSHSDYHRPSDDWEKVNIKGMVQVLDLVARTVQAIDALEKKPAYVAPTAQKQASGGGNGAYFGSIPSYTEDKGGVKLAGTSPGSPAEKAGLKKGDTIVKLGTFDIDDIYDFTNALSSMKPGDVIEVIVLREGKRETYKVTLARR